MADSNESGAPAISQETSTETNTAAAHEAQGSDDTAAAAPEAGDSPQDGAAPDSEHRIDEGKLEGENSEVVESPTLFYNGEQVQVEVPDDLSYALGEHGIDANKVVAELYREGGDFTLSEETLGQLYKVYPKGLVDSYMSSVKAQNDQALREFQSSRESAEQAEQAANSWGVEQWGGQEALDAVNAWLAEDTESVTDEQVAAFNAAMQSGSSYVQKLAIEDMKSRYKNAVGDGRGISLIEPGSGGSGGGGPLSREAYIQAVSSLPRGPGRSDAIKELDARRRAGSKLGI